MARFRRAWRRMRRRYKPVFRYKRRVLGKRKVRSRRIKPGDMILNIRRIQTLPVKLSENTIYGLTMVADNFKEFTDLKRSFEAYRIISYGLRVIPLHNVSNDSTSKIATYCIVPWKKEVPTTAVNYNDYLSIDKCRVYRGTQTAYRRLVPAVRLPARNVDASKLNTFGVTQWKPRIEIDGESTKIKHYMGVIAWQKDETAPESATAYYNVVETVKIKFYNQTTLGAAAVGNRLGDVSEDDSMASADLMDDAEELVADKKKRESLLDRLRNKTENILLN